MLDAIGVDTVDMFSLDVEGAELSVLKSIDWSRVTIKLLAIEVNHKGSALDDFLLAKGYRKADGTGKQWNSSDSIYLHPSLKTPK